LCLPRDTPANVFSIIIDYIPIRSLTGVGNLKYLLVLIIVILLSSTAYASDPASEVGRTFSKLCSIEPGLSDCGWWTRLKSWGSDTMSRYKETVGPEFTLPEELKSEFKLDTAKYCVKKDSQIQQWFVPMGIMGSKSKYGIHFPPSTKEKDALMETYLMPNRDIIKASDHIIELEKVCCEKHEKFPYPYVDLEGPLNAQPGKADACKMVDIVDSKVDDVGHQQFRTKDQMVPEQRKFTKSLIWDEMWTPEDGKHNLGGFFLGEGWTSVQSIGDTQAAVGEFVKYSQHYQKTLDKLNDHTKGQHQDQKLTRKDINPRGAVAMGEGQGVILTALLLRDQLEKGDRMMTEMFERCNGSDAKKYGSTSHTAAQTTFQELYGVTLKEQIVPFRDEIKKLIKELDKLIKLYQLDRQFSIWGYNIANTTEDEVVPRKEVLRYVDSIVELTTGTSPAKRGIEKLALDMQKSFIAMQSTCFSGGGGGSPAPDGVDSGDASDDTASDGATTDSATTDGTTSGGTTPGVDGDPSEHKMDNPEGGQGSIALANADKTEAEAKQQIEDFDKKNKPGQVTSDGTDAVQPGDSEKPNWGVKTKSDFWNGAKEDYAPGWADIFGEENTRDFIEYGDKFFEPAEGADPQALGDVTPPPGEDGGEQPFDPKFEGQGGSRAPSLEGLGLAQEGLNVAGRAADYGRSDEQRDHSNDSGQDKGKWHSAKTCLINHTREDPNQCFEKFWKGPNNPRGRNFMYYCRRTTSIGAKLSAEKEALAHCNYWKDQDGATDSHCSAICQTKTWDRVDTNRSNPKCWRTNNEVCWGVRSR